MNHKDIRHGKWLISFDPPPIPIRTMDYEFVHDAYDGPGPGRTLLGRAASVEDALAQIAELEAEWAEDEATPQPGGSQGGPVRV